MHTTSASLGIDVSKLSLDCTLLLRGKFKHRRFGNSKEGFEQLFTWLKKMGASELHACCEATGVYWEEMALAFHAQDIPISVVNPAQIKAFAESQLSRTKTDRQDAQLIAQFCAQQVPPVWTPPPPEERTLLAMVRDLQVLKELRVAEGNRLQTAHDSVKARIERHLEFLDQEIQALLQAIRDHIDRNDSLKRRRELLETIPGLGEKTIPWLLSFLGDGQRFETSKQTVAFVGLNPQHRQSGTSLHGKSHISKIGHADLRGALYMPAVVAYSKLPFFRPFVDRLRAAGKSAKVIIVALMRKLLVLAHAILKSGQPFNPNHAVNA